MIAKPESDDNEVIAKLDRRWQKIETGQSATVPHADVEHWLRTWGTPEFRPYAAYPYIKGCYRRT